MKRDRIPPGRFRWRLTVAFLAVAAVAAGVVAGGSYLLVANDRRSSFEERSIRDVHLTEDFALALVDGGVVKPLDMHELIRKLRRRDAFETVIIEPDGSWRSTSQISPDHLPKGFISGASLAPTETEIGGDAYFVVPGSRQLEGARIFFFFTQNQLNESLSRLAEILWRLWLLVVMGAALVGTFVARSALRPVARASAAARALAEGLLDTRLPVETEDEFGAWAVSFNEMAEALQEKIDALVDARERERRFTSDVSHELRTPLSALVTSASLLEAEVERMPTDLKWSVEQLVTQIRRVRRLLEELMEISRLDAGREVLEIQETKLQPLVQSMLTQRGWLERVQVETDGVSLATDRRRLERVLSNLIENALEHGAPPVTLSARPGKDEVIITVEDRGPGLASDDLRRIFDRFYKGDPSRSGGTGLGLSIAQENAWLLGGSIQIESQEGKGATFCVRLPLGTHGWGAE